MANDACTEERFLLDTAKHEMQIVRDDGVFRYIRFRRPHSSSYSFDLVTYPGYLVMSGDMGTYVFSRLPDMFEFFRTDREYNERKGRKLGINQGYWAEKLVAVDVNGRGDGSCKKYDPDAMVRLIKEQRLEWIRERNVDKEQRRELWDSLEELLDFGLEGDETRDYQVVNDWSWVPSGHDYRHAGYCRFQDLWDHNFKEYTFHFIWACYAIAWGVKTYDASKEVA